jgi:hypothetical protein
VAAVFFFIFFLDFSFCHATSRVDTNGQKSEKGGRIKPGSYRRQREGAGGVVVWLFCRRRRRIVD